MSKTLSSQLTYLDLRPISRNTNRCETTIYLKLERPQSFKWISLGEVQLRAPDGGGRSRPWYLSAYLKGRATDFEHDSARAISMALVGVDIVAVDYAGTRLRAYIEASYPRDFCVPPAGYNPLTDPEATVCRECEEHHVIVPEGMYYPRPDPELHSMLRGLEIEITIGFPLESKATSTE
jgi:hypothetical protein